MELALLIILLILTVWIGAPLLRGAPFVPTDRKHVEVMLRLAQVGLGTKLVDLGSGDGRIVIAAARLGAEAVGIEVNPILVVISRWRIKRAGVQDRAKVYLKNFWQADLSEFNVITLFGIGKIMPRLEKKFLAELKPGAKVASFAFQFPNWPASVKEESVYLYENLR